MEAELLRNHLPQSGSTHRKPHHSMTRRTVARRHPYTFEGGGHRRGGRLRATSSLLADSQRSPAKPRTRICTNVLDDLPLTGHQQGKPQLARRSIAVLGRTISCADINTEYMVFQHHHKVNPHRRRLGDDVSSHDVFEVYSDHRNALFRTLYASSMHGTWPPDAPMATAMSQYSLHVNSMTSLALLCSARPLAICRAADNLVAVLPHHLNSPIPNWNTTSCLFSRKRRICIFSKEYFLVLLTDSCNAVRIRELPYNVWAAVWQFSLQKLIGERRSAALLSRRVFCDEAACSVPYCRFPSTATGYHSRIAMPSYPSRQHVREHVFLSQGDNSEEISPPLPSVKHSESPRLHDFPGNLDLSSRLPPNLLVKHSHCLLTSLKFLRSSTLKSRAPRTNRLKSACVQVSPLSLLRLHDSNALSSSKKPTPLTHLEFEDSDFLLTIPKYSNSVLRLENVLHMQPITAGAAVAERLACSPPPKANGVQSPALSLPDFHMGESCRMMPLVGGFSRGLPFSPHFHSGAAPFSPHSLSSALATSLYMFGSATLKTFSQCTPRQGFAAYFVSTWVLNINAQRRRNILEEELKQGFRIVVITLDRRMNKGLRPVAMSILDKAEEETACIQVELKQYFQKCSFYREQPTTVSGLYPYIAKRIHQVTHPNTNDLNERGTRIRRGGEARCDKWQFWTPEQISRRCVYLATPHFLRFHYFGSASVSIQLARPPPTMASRVRFHQHLISNFRRVVNVEGVCRCPKEFLVFLKFPSPLHSVTSGILYNDTSPEKKIAFSFEVILRILTIWSAYVLFAVRKHDFFVFNDTGRYVPRKARIGLGLLISNAYCPVCIHDKKRQHCAVTLKQVFCSPRLGMAARVTSFSEESGKILRPHQRGDGTHVW
ncbi:hypothetical protein PR048_011924 [Dryococelus australis]|uniref:Uncharacterized protein n=1 Tax=Dryococelus australis TaxID=614101 RepID=A0ABQ9HNQ2_9NEOP|nr:hypothetical protein PR048_011924 [Dryococelus australis]